MGGASGSDAYSAACVSRYDFQVVQSLLGDFLWLLEQEPQHESNYSDERIAQVRGILKRWEAEGVAA